MLLSSIADLPEGFDADSSTNLFNLGDELLSAPEFPPNPYLTVLVTVVSGKQSVRENLTALREQINSDAVEIIVPFDKWSISIRDLAGEFPHVKFHFIEDIDVRFPGIVCSGDHRLYDYRRAVGIQLARGEIVAMIEDHAIPGKDWIQQIKTSHLQPYEVIGGAIENGIDRPLNRALYYCDFGRYGRPFNRGHVKYVSDVNVSYKRDALTSTREIWQSGYHETTLHWHLESTGRRLFLDDRSVVYQRRPSITIRQAVNERIHWGSVFAKTRTEQLTPMRRFLFATGSIALPLLLTVRAVRHMKRQARSAMTIVSTLPIILLLVASWSLGEFLGYINRSPSDLNQAIVPTR